MSVVRAADIKKSEENMQERNSGTEIARKILSGLER
jgi:hypothetical protein